MNDDTAPGQIASTAPDDLDTSVRRLPLLRADCPDPKEPCPYVTCTYHLFLDVTRRGEIHYAYPELFDADGAPELDLMPATCALDVADLGGLHLEEIGGILNVTRERSRQLEERALLKLRSRLTLLGITDYDIDQRTGIWDNAYVGTVRAD